MPAAPAASCALVVVERTRVTTSTPESPDVPARNGFTTYFVLSPVTGLFCHRHLRIKVLSKPGRADSTSANLTPASGRQDHTTSPYAATSLVRVLLTAHGFKEPALRSHRAQNAAASTASHPASVTIMIRPSCGVGWREFVEMICPTGEAKYFCKGDSTQNCPTGKSPRREHIPRVADAAQRHQRVHARLRRAMACDVVRCRSGLHETSLRMGPGSAEQRRRGAAPRPGHDML